MRGPSGSLRFMRGLSLPGVGGSGTMPTIHSKAFVAAASAESKEPRLRWPIGLPLVLACQVFFSFAFGFGGDTSM